MALNATTTAAAVGANDMDMVVTSATGASAGRRVKIDNEFAVVLAVTGTTVSLRTRGDLGTRCSAHDILAPVIFGDGADFPVRSEQRIGAVPSQADAFKAYGQDGAIEQPTRNTVALLQKGSAGAYTLGAPSLLNDGRKLTITAGTAFAHVVTATTLVEDGVTGGAKTTMTFAAFVGASITLRAVKGKWSVMGKNVVTVT